MHSICSFTEDIEIKKKKGIYQKRKLMGPENLNVSFLNSSV